MFSTALIIRLALVSGVANAALARTAIHTGHPEWVTSALQEFQKNFVSASLITVLITFLARVVWGATTVVAHHVRFHTSSVIVQCPMTIRLPDLTVDKTTRSLAEVAVYCQIVRFGTDDYIQKMATTQERFEGRLQNKVLPVQLSQREDGFEGGFLLPVHKRLGTQFRMFLTTCDHQQAIDLVETPYFQDLERHAKLGVRRISFALKEVQKSSNVEGLSSNNIYHPSHLEGFARMSRFSGFYLWSQKVRFAMAGAKWARKARGRRPVARP